MSDSESHDSDQGIRYKTDSVRNKIEITKYSSKSKKDSHHANERSRYRKRYSRAPSPRKGSYKKFKTNKRRSSRSNTTSSSDERNKNTVTKKRSKREDKTDYKKITETHLQRDAKSSLLENQKHVTQNHIIGPALPPHLLARNENPSTNVSLELENKRKENLPEPRLPFTSIGPKLPTPMINITKSDSFTGPQLPPQLLTSNKNNELREDLEYASIASPRQSQESNDEMIEPSLLAHLRKKEDTDVSCPESNMQAFVSLNQPQEKDDFRMIEIRLPPHLRQGIRKEIEDPVSEHTQAGDDSSKPQEKGKLRTIGPSLPPHLRKKLQEETEDPGLEHNIQDEEEDVYGPMPVGVPNYSLSHKALEERALQLKIDQLEPQDSNEPVRESWMIELPAAKAADFGLGPRQFRNRSGPDLSDRSCWTDLPGNKNKKQSGNVPVDLKTEAQLRELRKRDEEQDRLSKKHKRKEKSLLKMHREILEQEKKDEKPNERRPFSRDIDLQVNRFDEAQKQAIVKKAQLLDDRFSSGKSKFL